MSDNLQGPDRVEYWQALGRPFRKGFPENLRASDARQFRLALAHGNHDRASAYLEYLHPLYLSMVSTGFEWMLRIRTIVASRAGDDTGSKVHAAAFRPWHDAVALVTEAPKEEAAGLLAELFRPSGTSGDAPGNLPADPTRFSHPLLQRLFETPLKSYQSTANAIAARRLEEGGAAFESYLAQMRIRHDLLLLYVWAFTSATLRIAGRAVAEEGLRRSLQETYFYRPTVEMVCKQFAPADLAACLAEHLRTHFSGPARDGEVEVVEEKDCYRLRASPCGSGGMMRRLLQAHPVEGFDAFGAPSPSTWGCQGVPAYCAHCAQNEKFTYDLLGYPAWVTEFDPDPSRPCGWTIYKEPRLVPSRYFERLGVPRGAPRGSLANGGTSA